MSNLSNNRKGEANVLKIKSVHIHQGTNWTKTKKMLAENIECVQIDKSVKQ